MIAFAHSIQPVPKIERKLFPAVHMLFVHFTWSLVILMTNFNTSSGSIQYSRSREAQENSEERAPLHPDQHQERHFGDSRSEAGPCRRGSFRIGFSLSLSATANVWPTSDICVETRWNLPTYCAQASFDGKWVVPPPDTISPGALVHFGCVGKGVLAGSQVKKRPNISNE